MTKLHSRFRSTRSTIFLASLLALAGFSACGGGDEENGDGDGDPTTGGTGGSVGTGGAMGTGSTSGTTGGTGGENATGGAGGATGGADGSGGDGTGGNTPTSSYNCEPAVGEIPELTLEVVQGGFDDPVLVTHAPEDPRLFVVQRGGLIRIIDGDSIQAEPFLDLTSKVKSSQSEQGLLGLAFHPNFSDNGLFYVYYTATGGTDGRSVLEEYSLKDGSTTEGDPASFRGLINEDQPAWNHNGGQVTFGPDGMLYLALGDGGNTPQSAQNVTDLLGSLLRIDINGREEGQYSIPAGNLKDEIDSAAPEILSYGLRNPYRYNFDVCTGDLYLADVGQNDWEEITVSKAGVGQLNYGWDTMEGTHCYNPGNDCDESGITLPQIEYARGGGGAVVGGSVYRGSEIPGFRGKYIYSDAVKGQVWYAEYDATTNQVSTPVDISNELGSGGKALVSLQNGFDGEIYMSDRGGGTIYKLIAVPE